MGLKELEFHCLNYTLTEFLKGCTNEQLEYYIGRVLCYNIVGIRVNIYDALLNEMEYRENDEIINSNKKTR